jgi:HPt (histidine-containing phosphotransfer) domain-containing protein
MPTDQEYKDSLKIDIPEVLKATALPQHVYERILKSSLTSTEASLIELNAALAGKEWKKIGTIAHELKGVYANLRVVSLCELATKMCEVARAESSVEQVAELKSQFKVLFERLKSLLLT